MSAGTEIVTSKPPPLPGCGLSLELPGLPPHADDSRGIRNASHPRHDSFRRLQRASIDAMGGREPYHGPVEINLTVYAPKVRIARSLEDYANGVMDSLDGVVLGNGSQIVPGLIQFMADTEKRYVIRIVFLPEVPVKCFS